MLIIPTQPVPNQSFSVTLNNQQVTANLSQTNFGMFISLLLANAPLVTGQLCINQAPLVQEPYLGFLGELLFVDTMGTEDPVYTGLGTRFQLAYIEPDELASS